MSNCVVRSRGSRLPCSIVADHGIESGDHLSHDGGGERPAYQRPVTFLPSILRTVTKPWG
jgi:hypothetical protein